MGTFPRNGENPFLREGRERSKGGEEEEGGFR
jgi:hypothetical protein